MTTENLPQQALRTIHTSAIYDFGAQSPGARVSAGFPGSTASREAVHVCGPVAWQPNDGAAFGAGGRS